MVTTNPYNTIRVQNKSLEKYVSGVNDTFSFEQNEFVRKTESLPVLGYIKNGLLLFYAIIYLVLLLVLFIKVKKLSIYTKIGVVLLFGLYPIFIYTVENSIYKMYYYICAVIYGESYAQIMFTKNVQNPRNTKDFTNPGYFIKETAPAGSVAGPVSGPVKK